MSILDTKFEDILKVVPTVKQPTLNVVSTPNQTKLNVTTGKTQPKLNVIKFDEIVLPKTKPIETLNKFTATYYNPIDPNQTRPNNPLGIGAFSTPVKFGDVATGIRNIPQGTMIYIDQLKDVKTPFGNGIFRVNDRKNIRYNTPNQPNFDIALPPDTPNIEILKQKIGNNTFDFKIISNKPTQITPNQPVINPTLKVIESAPKLKLIETLPLKTKELTVLDTIKQIPSATIDVLRNFGFIPEKIDPNEPFAKLNVLQQMQAYQQEVIPAAINMIKDMAGSAYGTLATTITNKEEVKIPFSNKTVPTIKGKYNNAIRAGFSPLAATLLTSSQVAGDLLFFLGFAKPTIKTLGKIPVEKPKITTLSWKDISNITRGEEFAKVDPAKLAAFKKVSSEGIDFSSVLKRKGEISVTSGKPKTLAQLVFEEYAKVKGSQKGFVKIPGEEVPNETVSKSLSQEAKKYKTAEEFVKAQGEPLYHGTNADFTIFDKNKIGTAIDEGLYGKGFYFGNTKSFASVALKGRLAKNIMEVYTASDAKIFDISKINSVKEMADLLSMDESSLVQDSNGIVRPIRVQSGQFTSRLKNLGYDGVVINRGGDAIETVIFEPSIIKTKSQLTDIWNQANKAEELPQEVKNELEVEKITPNERQILEQEYGTQDQLSEETRKELYREIMNLGGIKKVGSFEYEGVPTSLIRSGGVHPDELAGELSNAGFPFASGDAILNKIKDLAFKAREIKARPSRPVFISDAITNSKDYQNISNELKDKINTFFRPSRQQKSRAFSLLGNKDTTIPLFIEIFDNWVKQGKNILVEPYAGAFTLGNHSTEKSIKDGLKEFHSNIFDKEKYTIVKAIQEGKIKEVENNLRSSVKLFSDTVFKYAQKNPNAKALLDEFFVENKDSYIGSKNFYSFIRSHPSKIGSRVTVFKDDYEVWQNIFQKTFKELSKKEVTNLSSAITNSMIKRIGIFGGDGQSLIRQQGFTSFEDKLFSKYGMLAGLEDINKMFKLANEYGTKVYLYNEDGAKLTNELAKKLSPNNTAFYFDPPYVRSSDVYDNASNLAAFQSGNAFINAHRGAFDLAQQGAGIALTNDVDAEWMCTVSNEIPLSSIFAYKEGNTPTSLITSEDISQTVTNFITQTEKVTISEREEVARIKAIKTEKNLSDMTLARIRHAFGIKELKNATDEQLSNMIDYVETLQDGDKLLTDMQIKGLEKLIPYGNFGKKPELITQREMQQKFGEQTEIMTGRIVGMIPNELFPTVDIKEDHPMVTRIVDKADILLRKGIEKVKERNERFDKLMTEAEKSEKISNKEVNKKIFQVMSGVKGINLTKEQATVVKVLRNFFESVRKDFALEKYRRNYITNLQAGFFEEVAENGILTTLKNRLKGQETYIPIDIMLALDDIIGSDKFFRFALERKGGITPTVYIRNIVNAYSNIVENKLALDQILPEAQAIQQLLLQGKNKIWMKRYLQNIKGRGLDYNLSQGKMKLPMRVVNKIIDINYAFLLGANYKSALKNLIGGESNSFMYQSVFNYARGKQRMLTNPIKSFRLIKKFGVLDGSYIDFVGNSLINKGKKISDIVLYGGMQAAEYEIRGSYFLGELTPEEWKTETLSDHRFRKILDEIAITQGIYTKVDSPLYVQTALGRAALQFGRWRITNALLLRRMARAATKDIKNGQYNTKNVRNLLSGVLIATMALWLGWELGKEGKKFGQQLATSAGELLNNIIQIISLKVLTDAITNNPTVSQLEEISFSLQTLLSHIGLMKEPYKIEIKGGIEDTYINALKLLEENEEVNLPKLNSSKLQKLKDMPELKLNPDKLNMPILKLNPAKL